MDGFDNNEENYGRYPSASCYFKAFLSSDCVENDEIWACWISICISFVGQQIDV